MVYFHQEPVGATIVTGKEITADNLSIRLAQEKPDVVVIATGSRSARDGFNGYFGREISGWEQENVYSYEDVLEGKVDNAKKVLLLDDIADELA